MRRGEVPHQFECRITADGTPDALAGGRVRSRPRALSGRVTNRRESSMVTHKASLLFGAALAILCTHCWQPVLAQEAAPSQPADQPAELTEIMVSAEKQATGRSIQKVPIAVTGVDASTMEQ